jgi:hypothetical protein
MSMNSATAKRNSKTYFRGLDITILVEPECDRGGGEEVKSAGPEDIACRGDVLSCLTESKVRLPRSSVMIRSRHRFQNDEGTDRKCIA